MGKKLSKKKIDACFDRLGAYCNYCGTDIIPENISIDHLKPKSLIYDTKEANKQENLILCCRHCNSSKGTKSLDEWRRVLSNRSRGIDSLTIQNQEAIETYFGDRLPNDYVFFFEQNRISL